MPCPRCADLKLRCNPFLRHWPGTSCERCILDNCACGPNRAMEFYATTDGDGNLEMPPEYVAMLEWSNGPLSENSDVVQCFRYLADIVWDSTCLHYAVDGVNPVVLTIALGAVHQALWPTDLVVYHIWERENCMMIYLRHTDLVSAGLTPSLATKQLDRERYPAGLLQEHTQFSQLERLEAYNTILRRGQRWRRMVDAATCRGPVLLDERCSVGHPTNRIGTIIEDGTDEEFDSFIEYLMEPILEFKEECLRISNLTRMITHLAKCSRDSEVRTYLADEIRSQLQLAFPPVLGTGDVSGENKRKLPFRIDRQKRAILDILGASIRFEGEVTETGQESTREAVPSHDLGMANRSQESLTRPDSRHSISSGYSSEDPLDLGGQELWVPFN